MNGEGGPAGPACGLEAVRGAARLDDLGGGWGAMVSRVIEAPVELVWRVFVDPERRRAWTADVDSVTVAVLEPGRRCRLRLLGARVSHQRDYIFTSIDVGQHRGGTVVTAVDERTAGLAERLLDLASGGFTARTVEGAVRAELDALADACTTTVIAIAA